jgi:hypothetical protein
MMSLAENFPEHTTHIENDLEYLGMNISYDAQSGNTRVHQHKYIKKILDKFDVNGMKDSQYPSGLDIFSGDKKDNNLNDKLVDRTYYLSMVMSLMYLAKRARPDILRDITLSI